VLISFTICSLLIRSENRFRNFHQNIRDAARSCTNGLRNRISLGPRQWRRRFIPAGGRGRSGQFWTDDSTPTQFGHLAPGVSRSAKRARNTVGARGIVAHNAFAIARVVRHAGQRLPVHRVDGTRFRLQLCGWSPPLRHVPLLPVGSELRPSRQRLVRCPPLLPRLRRIGQGHAPAGSWDQSLVPGKGGCRWPSRRYAAPGASAGSMVRRRLRGACAASDASPMAMRGICTTCAAGCALPSGPHPVRRS
jgi:hypothetical protein